MTEQPLICCFGELLWDIFPDRTLLGGAPLNVAMRLHTLGSRAVMIGAVGTDELGERALETMEQHGLETEAVDKLDKYPTGTVKVTLKDGLASYLIRTNVAWNHIKVSPQVMELAARSDALVFGSLALQEPNNRLQMDRLLEVSDFTVFDLNLREPFYTLRHIDQLMKKCHMAKLNEEELIQIAQFHRLSHPNYKEQSRRLQEIYGLHAICVTLGAEGAVLWLGDLFYSHPGYPSSGIDTVGAGDSFLATLLYEYLRGTAPGSALDRACAMGALVAGKEGANCTVSSSELAGLTERGPRST